MFSHTRSVTFLIFRLGGMMIMSLCVELEEPDSAASLSAAAAAGQSFKEIAWEEMLNSAAELKIKASHVIQACFV